jgi:O-antigen ligase
MRTNGRSEIDGFNSQRQSALIAAAVCAACLIGALTAFGGTESGILISAPAILCVLGLMTALVLDAPIAAAVRVAFVASFFFKADVNLFKIDEIEDPSGFNLSLTFVTAAMLIVYDQFSDQRERSVFTLPFAIPLLALFISAVVSVIYGGSEMLGWYSVWSFFCSIVVAYAVASHFADRERLLSLVTGIAAGILFTGLAAASQYLIEFPTNLDFFGTGTEGEMSGTQSEELSRVPAFLRTPTEMAWVISSLMPIAIAALLSHDKGIRNWRQALVSAAIGAGIVAVILSLARGSWIATVVSVPIVFGLGWLRLSAREKRGYLLSTIAVVLFGAIVFLPLAPRVYDRLTADDSGSAMIRLPLMETALRMIEDNAIVGVGLNGYRANMTRYDETQIFVSRVFPNPVHNVFAHVTAEIGIPGGIFFGLLIVAASFEAFRALGSRDRLVFAVALGILAGLVAFVMSAIKEPGSLGSVRPGVRTLFLLLGAAMAVSRIRRLSTSYGN